MNFWAIVKDIIFEVKTAVGIFGQLLAKLGYI